MRPNEQEQFEDLQRLLRESYPLPAPTEQFANRLQQQLLALLPTASQRPEPAGRWNQIIHRIGRLTMRQRIALGGVGAVAMLGFLFVGTLSLTQSASAMEKMAEEIRKAKSYKCVQIVRLTDESRKAGEAAVMESIYTVYWLAPGSARTEIKKTGSGWKGFGPEVTKIRPAGMPGIDIDHRTKKYRRYPALDKGAYSSTFDDLESLGRFSGEADHDLGTKEINGKQVHIFQIEMKKMEPQHPGGGLAEIWLDPDSNLPVFVRFTGQKMKPNYSAEQENRDIQWNIDFDPKLFDTTPPQGYTDATRKPMSLEKRVSQITDALRIYAEASKGNYPRAKIISRDTCDEVCKMLGLATWSTLHVPELHAPEGKNEARAVVAIMGISQIGYIQANSPDFAYHGTTVGPKDKDKVLLRWKRDDGRYEVIFGDLRAEAVTAGKLRDLEGK